jgi:hypothetical protein
MVKAEGDPASGSRRIDAKRSNEGPVRARVVTFENRPGTIRDAVQAADPDVKIKYHLQRAVAPVQSLPASR